MPDVDPLSKTWAIANAAPSRGEVGVWVGQPGETPQKIFDQPAGDLSWSPHGGVLLFFGEMGLFENRPTPRSAWVKARTECEVAEVSYSKFKQMCKEDADILFAVSAQLAGRLRATTMKVGNLAFLDVTGRVAATLLDLCKQPDAMTHPDGMQIKVTRQEIGRIVGCSREMVGRVLKNLEDQGLISVKGKTMVVYGTR